MYLALGSSLVSFFTQIATRGHFHKGERNWWNILLLSQLLQCRKNYEELHSLIMDNSVLLNCEDWCFTHKKMRVRIPQDGRDDQLSLAVGGSPCPDWSPFGKHGQDGGATAPAFMTQLFGFKHMSIEIPITMSLGSNSNANFCYPTCFLQLALRMKSIKQGRPKAFLHENVLQFPQEQIQFLLGRLL